MITIKNPGKNLQEVKPLVLGVWQRAVVFAVERLKLLNIKTINILTLHSRKTTTSSSTHYCLREKRSTNYISRYVKNFK